MLMIEPAGTDPYFNIALEEYLFRNFSEDCFMLWRNDDAIVVGKHQNALAEINARFAEENNIRVVRRLSGGGTVFHDPGNINFTFILTRDTEKVVDFKRYMEPIYEALKSLGLEVYYSERNDLFLDKKKISGNAEHAVKNKVLHHGTILYSAGIGKLSEALKVKPALFTDNAVKSVRSPVTNILPYMKDKMPIDEFMEYVSNRVRGHYRGMRSYRLNPADIEAINKLVNDKYSTWEWNYGYSPKYEFHNAVSDGPLNLEINLSVKKGVIEEVNLQISGIPVTQTDAVKQAFSGLQHRPELLSTRLKALVGEGHIPPELSSLLGKALLE